MTTTQKIGLGVVLALVAFTSAFIGGEVAGGGAKLGGGAYEALSKWFGNGLTAGSSQQFAISSTGAVTNSTSWTLGSSGTTLTRLNAGTCYIQPYATTIAASSTALVDCQATAAVASTSSTYTNDSALTGVTYGDGVNVTLATSTGSATFLGLNLESASASGTAGYIQLRLSNKTGATFTWPTTGTASGTASYIATH